MIAAAGRAGDRRCSGRLFQFPRTRLGDFLGHSPSFSAATIVAMTLPAPPEGLGQIHGPGRRTEGFSWLMIIERR